MLLARVGDRVINLEQIVWCELEGERLTLWFSSYGASLLMLDGDEARECRALLQAAFRRHGLGRWLGPSAESARGEQGRGDGH